MHVNESVGETRGTDAVKSADEPDDHLWAEQLCLYTEVGGTAITKRFNYHLIGWLFFSDESIL